jgi:hypothetical protein
MSNIVFNSGAGAVGKTSVVTKNPRTGRCPQP